jgi:hypothetical protein
MSDLVKCARSYVANNAAESGADALIVELADRIEALEAELESQDKKSAKIVDGILAAAHKDHVSAAARIEALEATLRRCQTVLANMALENKGAIFNRWPINHEPLRNDARNLLPVIEAALDQDAGIGCGKSVIEPWNAEEK